MKVENQYTDLLRKYTEENGTDIFIEYKDENTTEERKKELEDVLFNMLRQVNEIPMANWNDTIIDKSMIALSEVSKWDTYKDGDFGLNSVGVNVLYNFFPELCDVKKEGAKSIREFFNDDKKLRRAVRKTLSYSNNELSIYRWIIMCGAGYCVNFRPAAAKAIYEVYGKPENCKVFDSSAGYGARMMGAHFAENVVEYLGIDPNTADHCQDEKEFLDKRYDTGTKKQVLKMGSEDFTPEAFPQYQNYFDLYFTSPPYFDTERYSEDETQSYKKFPTYAGWVKGFYRQTIYNACDALKIDGVFSINIFEKVPNIKELTKLFLADKGFYVVKTDRYLLRTMPGAGKKDENGVIQKRDMSVGSNFEPIWVAKHYSQLLKEGLITEEQALKYKERAVEDKKVASND